jgi:hypothetical protein
MGNLSSVHVRVRGVELIFVLGLACAACGTTTPSNTTAPTQVTLTVALNAASVVGGTPTSGVVTATGAVPAAGLVVALTSGDASATVTASVTITAAGTSVPFSVSTNQVPTMTSVRITASSTASSTTPAASGFATLTVQPIPSCGPFLSAQVAIPFSVYVDDGDPRNHFIPSGFFGDIGDLTLSQTDRSAPHGGTTAIRIDYRPSGSQRFAGIFWQCPENNFGTVQGAGFNLSRARQVQFWARSSVPAQAEFKVGGIGTAAPRAPFPESLDSTTTIPVVVALGTDWRQFTIDLTGRDLTRVIGGFMFVTNTAQNPSGLTLYLDDIVWQ